MFICGELLKCTIRNEERQIHTSYGVSNWAEINTNET